MNVYIIDENGNVRNCGDLNCDISYGVVEVFNDEGMTMGTYDAHTLSQIIRLLQD